MMNKFLLSLLVSCICVHGADSLPEEYNKWDHSLGFDFTLNTGPHGRPIHEELRIPQDQVEGIRDIVRAHGELLAGIAQEGLSALFLLGTVARIDPAKRSALMQIIDDYSLLERAIPYRHQVIHVPHQMDVIEILAELDPADLLAVISVAKQNLALEKMNYLSKVFIFKLLSKSAPEERSAQLKTAISMVETAGNMASPEIETALGARASLKVETALGTMEYKAILTIRGRTEEILTSCRHDLSKLTPEIALSLFIDGSKPEGRTWDIFAKQILRSSEPDGPLSWK